MSELRIFVAGQPVPQGSKRFVGMANGRGLMIEANKKTKPWREDVRAALLDKHGKPKVAFNGDAIAVELAFVMKRPIGTPKKRTPLATKKPDLDKLTRAIFDAVSSAGVWADDSQVILTIAKKRIADIGETAGCHIHIARAEAL